MGFGKVGSEVARRAKGLGMNVIAHDPYAPVDRARALGVELVSFDEAITRADFLSLHMPLTPSTDKIFNDDSFSKMKKGARIVNVARGGVIDEPALLRALESGQVAQVSPLVFPFYSLLSFVFLIIFLGFFPVFFSHLLTNTSSFLSIHHPVFLLFSQILVFFCPIFLT